MPVSLPTVFRRTIDAAKLNIAISPTDNVEYGFDPHDDSDYIHVVGNDVWGNGELSRLWAQSYNQYQHSLILARGNVFL